MREALWMAVQLAGPPLAAMLVIGLIISILQALTQIQEATLAFLPKLAVMGMVLLLLGPAMVGSMRGYAVGLFDRIVAVGGLP
ncbi:flagellar biosynthetic protein FliQ [Siccirubricoccus deserti]